MNWLLGAIVGYCLHDALQPTPIGKVLDNLALPSDTFVKPEEEAEDA